MNVWNLATKIAFTFPHGFYELSKTFVKLVDLVYVFYMLLIILAEELIHAVFNQFDSGRETISQKL